MGPFFVGIFFRDILSKRPGCAHLGGAYLVDLPFFGFRFLAPSLVAEPLVSGCIEPETNNMSLNVDRFGAFWFTP
jgi:hypothetical protein